MNKNLQGELSSTVGRQARLDVLKQAFEGSPYKMEAIMEPLEVAVDGDRAFARVDGTLILTPKTEGRSGAYSLALDIYLFFHKAEGNGWQCERSMGIETSRTDI